VIHQAVTPRAANHRVPIRRVAIHRQAAVQANRANPTASPIAARRKAADQTQVAIPPRVAQAAIHRVVRQANRQQVFLIRSLRAAIRPSRYPAVPVANPANRPIPVLTARVPMIRNHPNRTVCQAYRAVTLHRANQIPVIPNQAIPNRVNQTRAIQSRHLVNRLARVDRRRIRAIQHQATQVDRAQVKVPRAAAIPIVLTANHRAIRKASLIRTVAPSARASQNLLVIVGVNRKANRNQNRRATLKANHILAAIPTVLADQVTLAAVRRVRADLAAQAFRKAPPKATANRPAIAVRKAKAKIQVAIDPRIARAIIQAIATQQVIIHQEAHRIARQTATQTAIPIHSHRILTHLTVVAQAHRIRSHQANHRQEVPAAVAQVHGFGHAAGSCLIPTVKAQNHPRAPAATTAR
jgi:hypothetical protein